jgi:hypothetical protein
LLSEQEAQPGIDGLHRQRRPDASPVGYGTDSVHNAPLLNLLISV